MAKMKYYNGTAWEALDSKNADTATKLATARSIALSGDVSGSATFDGSANISITATVADDSHNHIIGNVDGLQTALDGKSNTSHTHTTYESHLTDTTNPHSVTPSQIGAETPTGAQSKANTAETNAINFTKSQGIGNPAQNVSSTDWNSHVVSGFYMGQTMTNRPPYTQTVHSWDYGIVVQHNDLWCVQTVTDFYNNETWQRHSYDASGVRTWGAWKRMIDEEGGTLTGNLVAPSVNLNNSNTQLAQGNSGALKVTTPSGYVDMGSMNTSYAHFQTDRPSFHFNKSVKTSSNIDVSGNANVVGDANVSGKVVSTLNHSSSYFTIKPYSGTYDDGSYMQTYYDGNNNRWITQVRNSTGVAEGLDISANDFIDGSGTRFSTLKSDVSNGKIQVRDAITGKGGTVADADGDGYPTFQELTDGVNSITSSGATSKSMTTHTIGAGATYTKSITTSTRPKTVSAYVRDTYNGYYNFVVFENDVDSLEHKYGLNDTSAFNGMSITNTGGSVSVKNPGTISRDFEITLYVTY